MGQIILGVGDYGASNQIGEEVKTFALGSCVSVVLLDPKTRTVGMVHVALPESVINKAKSIEKPGYFADTGIPALLSEMAKFGCNSKGIFAGVGFDSNIGNNIRSCTLFTRQLP